MARRKHFREDAAAFMKGLTSGVAALLDSFDKLNCKRAAALHERFAGYAADRRDATAIWRGGQPGRHQAAHKPAAICPLRQKVNPESRISQRNQWTQTRSHAEIHWPIWGIPAQKNLIKGGSK